MTHVLLFIRHAETDMAGTFCGQSNPAVNLRGRQQILDLIEHLADEAIDQVYCSDLQRAVLTASEVAQTFRAPVIKRPGLREIGFGDWEGLTWHQIEQRDPSYAKQWIKDFPALPAPGGESFVDFEDRVMDEVRDLLVLAKSKKIAVVSHRGVMRVVLQKLHGCSEQEAFDLTSSYCCWFTCSAVKEVVRL